MERMTVNYDSATKKVICDPDTIHVPKFCTEDILLILHDDIVHKFDFAKKPITFENGNYGKRFSQVPLNDKALWLHDDNTAYHQSKEDAKFTVTITDSATKKDKSLDPRVVND